MTDKKKTSTEENNAIENIASASETTNVIEPCSASQPASSMNEENERPKLLFTDNALGAENSDKSFFDMIYDKIDNVIGGGDPNQFLCITLPGQVISPEDFTYDYKNNAPKGPTIEANESRLANKLFDPCHIAGADNGMTLPYQYRSALDTLTPKLNEKIAISKNQLRELLLTPYPYDFGDNNNKTYTLQEVFYRLYDEYVAAEKEWAEKQNQAKDKFRKLYPGTDIVSNTKYNDAYLEWYETVAQSEITALNEKRSKVLSVFSPNDMDILAGILDSGSGAELEQAREVLHNAQKLAPDGGYVYPVKFNPTHWFELLNPSFTPCDLLKTPDALAMELQSLSSRRITLSARISEISTLIPNDSTIKKLQEEVKAAQTALDASQNDLLKTYGEGIKTVVSTAFDIASLFNGGSVPKKTLNKLAKGSVEDKSKIDQLVNDLSQKLAEGAQAQSKLINAAQQLSSAMMNAIEAQNLSTLKNLISPMKEQLDQIDAQIKDVQMNMQLSTVISADTDTSINGVAPPEVPVGYTQILIEASTSAMDTKTNKSASASSSTSGASFWFAGYSSNSSKSSSSFATMTGSKSSKIQIGMNVMKVGIEREWFNPGVFILSKDMFNVSTSRVSPSRNYTAMTDERIKEMNENFILPCYPTAMLIARDISIKIITAESLSSSFAESTESHASHGGGFLFFSGSSSSSSSSSSSGAHATSNDNSVTIKFNTPQIIGYYLQATPPDKSSILDDISGDQEAGFVTISKFVSDYKSMLEKMNKKEKCE